MKFRKYSFDQNVFNKIDNAEKAYWLGFLMGDGNINQKGNALFLEISNKDKDHLEKFKQFIKGNQPIKNTRKNCSRIIVCGKQFVNTLEKLGVTRRKTFKTQTPPIEEKLLPNFYLGILDSDGWLTQHQTQHEFGFSSACPNFLLEIQQWFKIKLNKDCGYLKQRIRKNQKVWQLIIGGNKNFIKIYNILYSGKNPVYLERKYHKAKQFFTTLSAY